MPVTCIGAPPQRAALVLFQRYYISLSGILQLFFTFYAVFYINLGFFSKTPIGNFPDSTSHLKHFGIIAFKRIIYTSLLDILI